MLSLKDFYDQSDQTLELLKRLVEVESPSTEKPAVDRLGFLIHQELLSLGASVSVVEQAEVGNHILGQWGSTSNGGILVLCHMDTVYGLGTLQKQSIRMEDSRLFGPGALDMKSGIAIFLEAMRLLRWHENFPNRPLTALFTSDEETGSLYSRPLIERLASQAALVLCLEPAAINGALKTARKGTGDLEIVAYGRATHAGVDHENGRNAIEELAHHILAAQRLTDYSRGTTASVGKVKGGTRRNVVPDEARAWVDIRIAFPEEAGRIHRWAESLHPVLDGTQVTVTFTQNRPPMVRDATMVATFQRVSEIADLLSLELKEGSTGGASDANFVAPLGVPVIDGLGGIGEGAHSEREYVLIESLPERAALLAAILTEW